MNAQSVRRRGGPAERSLARLAAVQALYQAEMTGAPVESVIAEFVRHRLPELAAREGLDTLDAALFGDLVRGAGADGESLDRLIGGMLAPGWRFERLSQTMRALLRAAAQELRTRADIPPRVTVSEFVDIAQGFFPETEVGFVNGLLDRLARQVRAAEMGQAPADPSSGHGRPAR